MNTTRHALFLPVDRDAKYEGKTAIDSFFWRFGDLVQAGVVFAGLNWFGWGAPQFALLNLLLASPGSALRSRSGASSRARRRERHQRGARGRRRRSRTWPARPGTRIDHRVPADAFVDADPGDVLHLAARLADGRPLPRVAADSSRAPRRFSGPAPAASSGSSRSWSWRATWTASRSSSSFRLRARRGARRLSFSRRRFARRAARARIRSRRCSSGFTARATDELADRRARRCAASRRRSRDCISAPVFASGPRAPSAAASRCRTPCRGRSGTASPASTSYRIAVGACAPGCRSARRTRSSSWNWAPRSHQPPVGRRGALPSAGSGAPRRFRLRRAGDRLAGEPGARAAARVLRGPARWPSSRAGPAGRRPGPRDCARPSRAPVRARAAGRAGRRRARACTISRRRGLEHCVHAAAVERHPHLEHAGRASHAWSRSCRARGCRRRRPRRSSGN